MSSKAILSLIIRKEGDDPITDGEVITFLQEIFQLYQHKYRISGGKLVIQTFVQGDDKEEEEN